MALNAIPRPEAALNRAQDHLNSNQPQEAIEVLHSLINNRRLRSTGWDEHVEKVMLLLISLCVKHEKLKAVREALYSYRALTCQHNTNSLAKAVQELTQAAEEKLEAVKKQVSSDAKEGLADDLEAQETPETLMISSLQLEVRDQSAKLLHNSLLCCWECYKVIMDLLRYTPKIDYLYHATAQKAMEFCRDNKRPQEFRRLCDQLRLHYQTCQKQRHKQPEFEQFLRPETHLATRLTQLSVAADLCLWNQCFQTAEDILSLGLYDLVQKCVSERDSLLHKHRATLLHQTSVYYNTLATIFRVSEQPVFHASAVLKNIFHARQHKKNLDPAEKEALYDIGTLAVMCATEHNAKESRDPDYKRKLATMLAHTVVPTQKQMQTAVEASGFIGEASTPVRELYELFEGPIEPLTLCRDTDDLLKQLKGAQLLYVPDLKRVAFEKLITKLASVYTAIRIDFFTSKLCPESFLPWATAERYLVHLADASVVPARLDYMRSAILLGPSQVTAAETVSSGLVSLARVLSDVLTTIGSSVPVRVPIAGKLAAPIALSSSVGKHFDFVHRIHQHFYTEPEELLSQERTRLAARQAAIKQRKEEQELEKKQKEQQRAELRMEQERLSQQKEQEHRQAVQKQQNDKKLRNIMNIKKLETAMLILKEFKALASRATSGKVVIKGKPVDEITVDDIASGLITHADYEAAQEQLKTKERQERLRQRRAETKRMEHLVRAIRTEEAPFLETWRKECKERDDKLLANLREEEENARKAERQAALELQEILKSVQTHKDHWVCVHLDERRLIWEQRQKERNERLIAKLRRAKIDRANERMRSQIERMREEEERIQREAEARALAEEQRQREEEEAARKQREEKEAEERHKIMEQTRERAQRMQREKDLEIERRLAAEANASTPFAAAPADQGARWRDTRPTAAQRDVKENTVKEDRAPLVRDASGGGRDSGGFLRDGKRIDRAERGHRDFRPRDDRSRDDRPRDDRFRDDRGVRGPRDARGQRGEGPREDRGREESGGFGTQFRRPREGTRPADGMEGRWR